MLRAAGLGLCLAVAASGCGGEDDHTQSFVACLQRHGGIRVRTAPQLAGLPWEKAEDGSSFGLERLVYSEIYVGDRAVVVLFPLGLRGDDLIDEAFARAVRTRPSRFRAVVLMPPEREPGEIDDACLDAVAPGEAVP